MIEVVRIPKEEWGVFSEKAHLIVFGKVKPKEWDRIDFALVVQKNDKMMGYVTCREHDAKTVYWQFGGSFPGTKDTVLTWTAYQEFVGFCKGKYDRITTIIENTNTVMLKMAMKVGFRIVGVKSYNGSVLLEHVLELQDEKHSEEI